jgi:hypothetical protein
MGPVVVARYHGWTPNDAATEQKSLAERLRAPFDTLAPDSDDPGACQRALRDATHIARTAAALPLQGRDWADVDALLRAQGIHPTGAIVAPYATRRDYLVTKAVWTAGGGATGLSTLSPGLTYDLLLCLDGDSNTGPQPGRVRECRLVLRSCPNVLYRDAVAQRLYAASAPVIDRVLRSPEVARGAATLRSPLLKRVDLYYEWRLDLDVYAASYPWRFFTEVEVTGRRTDEDSVPDAHEELSCSVESNLDPPRRADGHPVPSPTTRREHLGPVVFHCSAGW